MAEVVHKEVETRRSRNTSLKFVVLSLVLHSSLMFTLSRPWFEKKLSGDPKTASTDIEIVPLSQKDIDKLKGQIAESSLVQKSEKAAKNAFLSAQTQVVQEQTRAKDNSSFRDGKTGGGGGKAQAQPTENAPKLGSLGVKMDFKPLGNLGPGETASTSDYLRDVKPGAQTLLNTKEFAYFSYYQRVRRQLEQYWEPGLRKRLRTMFERGRQLAADQEHATKVLVVMNPEGTITKVLVESTSGMLDLDQAAIDAFNRAGPFPNPPKGMIDREGTVKLEWEFVLKT